MCPECAAIRQKLRKAFLDRKISEAVKQMADGTAKLTGLSKKTAIEEEDKDDGSTIPDRGI